MQYADVLTVTSSTRDGDHEDTYTNVRYTHYWNTLHVVEDDGTTHYIDKLNVHDVQAEVNHASRPGPQEDTVPDDDILPTHIAVITADTTTDDTMRTLTISVAAEKVVGHDGTAEIVEFTPTDQVVLTADMPADINDAFSAAGKLFEQFNWTLLSTSWQSVDKDTFRAELELNGRLHFPRIDIYQANGHEIRVKHSASTSDLVVLIDEIDPYDVWYENGSGDHAEGWWTEVADLTIGPYPSAEELLEKEYLNPDAN